MSHPLIQAFEKSQIVREANFVPGDNVEVYCKIVEGDKERTQIFAGTVIARRGKGINEFFTVRKIVAGEGVERVFPVQSPRIEKIDVKRRGRTKRAKLYYLRDRVGKATRLREETRKGRVIVVEELAQEQAKA